MFDSFLRLIIFLFATGLLFFEYFLLKKCLNHYFERLEQTIIKSLLAWEQIKHEQISSFSVEGDVQ